MPSNQPKKPASPAAAKRHALKMQMAARLKELLELRGMNLAELARRTGVPSSNVSNWGTGKRRPTPEQMADIAKALQVTTDDLMQPAGTPLSGAPPGPPPEPAAQASEPRVVLYSEEYPDLPPALEALFSDPTIPTTKEERETLADIAFDLKPGEEVTKERWLKHLLKVRARKQAKPGQH